MEGPCYKSNLNLVSHFMFKPEKSQKEIKTNQILISCLTLSLFLLHRSQPNQQQGSAKDHQSSLPKKKP